MELCKCLILKTIFVYNLWIFQNSKIKIEYDPTERFFVVSFWQRVIMQIQLRTPSHPPGLAENAESCGIVEFWNLYIYIYIYTTTTLSLSLYKSSTYKFRFPDLSTIADSNIYSSSNSFLHISPFTPKNHPCSTFFRKLLWYPVFML